MFNQHKILCSEGNYPLNLCISRSCSSSSIQCDVQSCICHQQHHNCQQQIQFTQLINKLQKNHTQCMQPIRKVIQWYQTIIKLFTIEKQELIQKVEDYSLSGSMRKEQFELLTQIYHNNCITLQSKDIGIMLKKFGQNHLKKIQKYNSILHGYIQQNQKNIENMILIINNAILNKDIQNKLKQTILNKGNIISSQDIIRGCKIKELQIDNKIASQSQIQEFKLNEITGICLHFITQQAIEVLAESCSMLRKLKIKNTTDQLCNTLAINMGNLSQLIIQRSSITDIGGITLAGSIPNLNNLQIYQHNITPNGKKLMKSLFPKYKTLKI